MNYNNRYVKQVPFIVIIILLAGSGFYNWYAYQTNKSLEVQIRDSVKNAATVMLSELRNIESETSDLDMLSQEDTNDMIRRVDNMYILAMTLPVPINIAAEYPLTYVKQGLFEHAAPTADRNLKFNNEEIQDFLDLQLDHAYEVIDIVCNDQYKFNQNNYSSSLKKQAFEIQDKYEKALKSKAYYNKFVENAANI